MTELSNPARDGMNQTNLVSTADLLYLQVNPKKLSDKKVAQVYDRLNRKGKVVKRHASYTNTVDKTWFIRHYFKFVDIWIEKGELGHFIELFQLNLDDFKNVRGGNQADIRVLSEKTQAELNESESSYRLPGKPIKTEPGENLEKSILETVEELAKEEAAMSDLEKLEESLLMDDKDQIDMTALTDMTNIENETAPLNSQIAFDGSISRSMLDAGIEEESVVFPAKRGSEVEKANVKILTSGESKTDIKLDATASIPVWRKSLDPDENDRLVEMYIRDLGRIKTLDIGKNDAWLINASLVKSNRTDMYVELPSGADSDINEFIKYLKAAYGMSKVAKRKALNNIKQGATESPHAFLSRIVNTYYEVRGEQRKTLDVIENDKNEKYDIVSLYLKGLINPKVRVAIKQNIGEIKLPKLSTITRDIVEALADDISQNSAVNLVLEGNSAIQTQVTDLSKKLESLSINLAQFKYNNNHGSGSPGKFNNQRNRNHNNNGPYHNNNKNNQNKSKGQAKNNQDKPKNDNTQKPSEPPKNVVFNGSCYYCGRKGHSKRFCRKRAYDMAHPSQ